MRTVGHRPTVGRVRAIDRRTAVVRRMCATPSPVPVTAPADVVTISVALRTTLGLEPVLQSIDKSGQIQGAVEWIELVKPIQLVPLLLLPRHGAFSPNISVVVIVVFDQMTTGRSRAGRARASRLA
jgi:hypothetical protein